MPCQVSDISVDVAAPPGPGIPGFGPPFSPIQIPLPDLDLPTDLLEDILELMRRLGALFPSSLFKPNLDSMMKNILDFISSILDQIAPFLSFYNFIMALLNLIVCIIEVLCAIPNPFAVAEKLRVLFAECLPPFLNLFPWLALIAMILALLLLILALIEYIIRTIIAIIEQIIRNIILLTEGLTLQDAESTLGAAQKIASLLCLIESILAILIALAAIIAIIQALAKFAGIGICDDNDDTGCCPPDICPEFIKLNEEIQVTSGTMVYHRKIGADLSAAGLPPALLDILGGSIALRPERWQIYENDLDPQYPIGLIITPSLPIFFGSQIFYPEQSFAADTPPTRAAYTVDLTMNVNPSLFGLAVLGDARNFVIKDCIVVRKPIFGVRQWNEVFIPGLGGGTGTLEIEGGKVFESDGETPVSLSASEPGTLARSYGRLSVTLPNAVSEVTSVVRDSDGKDIWNTDLSDGFVVENIVALPSDAEDDDNLGAVGQTVVVTFENQLTLNDFIHEDDLVDDDFPLVDDGYVFEDIEFVWKPQHSALAGFGLITVGCFPGVSVEKAVQNAAIFAEGIEPIADRVPNLDGLADAMNTALDCSQNAINKFRGGINLGTTEVFRNEILDCLNDLNDEVVETFCQAFAEGISTLKSEFSIDNDVQFVTRPINVTIILRDGGGTNIGTGLPTECLRDLLGDGYEPSSLVGNVTFGQISDVEYDRDNAQFTAQITSGSPGRGELTVLYNGQPLSELVTGVDLDNPSSIVERVLTYEFISDAPDISGDEQRRGRDDVAGDGTE